MQNQEIWKPSKFVDKDGALRASRDPQAVGVGSRLIVDLVAERYGRHLREHARGRLLDLGCGKVPLYGAYREYVSENICVDWGGTLHKNAHLDYEFDLTEPLPLDDNAFETIILSDVLEHIPAPDQLWKEMARLLSPGGKVVVNVPFYYWLHEQPHDYYRYTEFALRRFVDTSGLRLVHMEALGGVPEILADIFAKNILRLTTLGPSLASMAQQVTLAFVRSTLGRKISRETSRDFPFGYFLIAQKPS